MSRIMNNNRRHSRLLFSARDHLEAVLVLPECPESTMDARLLNISAGGIGLAVKKELSFPIKAGQNCLLKHIKGHPDWTFIQHVTLEIKWCMQNDFLEHIAFGCEFSDLSQALQKKIDQQVQAALSRYHSKIA